MNKPEPVSVPDRETPGLTRNVKITKLSVKLGPMQRRGKVKILHCLPANLLKTTMKMLYFYIHILPKNLKCKNYTWLIETQILSDN